jgi:pyruvate formate lyase activating enzyme
MKKQALYGEKTTDSNVQCSLCAHSCHIAPGKRGICAVRENINGTLYTLNYGLSTSPARDPIEKKPLYHFHPGTQVFSLGSVGCNFKCAFCQNFTSSTSGIESSFLHEIPPKEAVRLALSSNCSGIAFTYNEPTIWYEYSLDTARLAKQQNLYTVYVTNGYIQEQPLREIAPVLDAMNIDVKAFTHAFYKKTCKATLEPVLATCKLAHELGIHIELTYLVIPGLNDSEIEVTKFCTWVVKTLGKQAPVHFSRFHPDYMMTDTPPTPLATLQRCYSIAQHSGILFTYLGNVPHGPYENTICPSCGATCIERYGFTSTLKGVKHGQCTRCGTSLALIINQSD